MSAPPKPNDAQVRFGRLLLERRCALGWSRKRLALESGVSEGTIKLLELGTGRIGVRTLYPLTAVKALRITDEELATYTDQVPDRSAPEAPGAVAARRFTMLLCASADPLSLHREQRAIFRGAGGHLRVAWSYVDAVSAADWQRFNQARGGSGCASAVARLVPSIAAYLQGAPLDLFGMGAGLAEAEIQLSLSLAASKATHLLSVGLCDVSGPLLCAGYLRAQEALDPVQRAHCWACQVDLERLGADAEALIRPGPVRLFSVLGDTLGELDDPGRFLASTLPALAAPGDLLLLDVPDATPNEEIPHVRELFFEWLRGPFERAGLNVLLDVGAPRDLEGAEERAVTASSPGRRWSCYRLRRFDVDALTARLPSLGWHVLERLSYPGRRGGVLLLCARVSPKKEVRRGSVW
ncbi:MAG: helix-turn-helix transcriptional regulator [Polyangia bacterium]